MHALLIVLLLGTGLNVANDHPHNLAGVEASIRHQLEAPVIDADYSHLNQ